MRTIVTFSTIAVAGVIAGAAAQTPRTTWSGVYSEAQAKRGAAVYDARCSSCHAPDLTGLDQAPPLAGSEFNTNWNDLSVNDLFERIRISMPADKPGSLSREEAADVVAFILSKGNFPAGDAELPTDGEPLKEIKFTAAKPQP